MLTEIYRPKNLNELVGQDGLALTLRRWADSWIAGKPAYRCVFEHGPPGTGKTSSVFALANEKNYDVVEVNASDFRTAKELVKELWSSIYFTPSKEDKPNIILIDEVDGILGDKRTAKKAFLALEELIEATKCPIIFTCNEEYDIRRMTTYFKDNALMIRFSPIKDIRIHERLLEISKAEGIKIPNIDRLLEVSHGDLRFAISNMDNPDLPDRYIKQDIFKIVHSIFQGKWDGNCYEETPDFIWYVVKSNLPNFYNDIDGIPLNEYILSMDKHFSHIWKRVSTDSKEAFRFWKYAIMQMRLLPYHQKSAKINITKKDYYEPRGGYVPPERRNKEIQEYAQYCHMSYKKANSKLEPSVIEIWQNMPKIEIENASEDAFVVEMPKIEAPKVKGIFDYSSE